MFYCGGHGPLFDVVNSEGTAAVAEQVYAAGGVVAAVCHGPVGLVPVKDISTGRPIVEGKRVRASCFGLTVGVVCAYPSSVRLILDALVRFCQLTAFTNAEEEAVGLTGAVPYPLESKLVELGAVFEPAGLFQAKVVVDGRLITGQNPASATGVGEALVEALASLP